MANIGRSANVRGQFREYGDAYRKGVLFGKYEGRFFIPSFARGDREQGGSVQRFKLR